MKYPVSHEVCHQRGAHRHLPFAAALPDRPTLQFGPGGIAEAILASLNRPVSIWSGLVTESVAELAERGILEGEVTAAYAWPAASGPSGLGALARQGRLDCEAKKAAESL